MKRTPQQKISPLQVKTLWRFGVVIVLLAVLWLIFAPEAGLYSVYRQRTELRAMQSESKKLAGENEQLELEIEKLSNDPAYLEDVARRNYGLLKPYERVYDFSRPEKGKDN